MSYNFHAQVSWMKTKQPTENAANFNFDMNLKQITIHFIVYDHKNYCPFFFLDMWVHLANITHPIILVSGILLTSIIIIESQMKFSSGRTSSVHFILFISNFFLCWPVSLTNWISTTTAAAAMTTTCRLKTNKCHDEIMCCVGLSSHSNYCFVD